MITSFNEHLCLDFDKDVEAAIYIENLVSWIRYNAGKDIPSLRNFHEGRYWSYDSYPEISRRIRIFSPKQMRTIIARCVRNGLIIIGNFNKKKYDNTNWYTLTDKAWAYFPAACKALGISFANYDSSAQGLNTPAQTGTTPAQTGRPIPSLLNTLGNINITISTSDDAPMIANQEIVDAYHEELPDLPRIKVVDSKLKAQLTHMRKNWPKYQKDGKKFSIDSFRDYLRYIKQFYPWLIKPYTTQNGNVKRNNLRVLTREINITKIVNGEFNAQ